MRWGAMRGRRDLSAQWIFFGVKPWQLRLLLLQWADDLPVMSEPNSRPIAQHQSVQSGFA
jgi:hypothetical protein